MATATKPDKSKLDLVKEAQAEVQSNVTAKRNELIDALMEHKSIGGEDQAKESLLEIVERFPEGISYPFLQSVFPDVNLTAAREELKKENKIEQIGKKGKVTLKPKAVE